MRKSSFIIALYSICLCSYAFAQKDILTKSDSDYLLKHPKRIEWEEGGFYTGVFEDGTPFQMNLQYPVPKAICKQIQEKEQSEDACLRYGAHYWYPRKFNGDSYSQFNGSVIFLRGEFSKNGSFVLTRSDADEIEKAKEEHFAGTFSQDKLKAYGQWTQSGSKKVLRFHMHRAFLYKAVAVYFPVKSEERHSKLYASFPVINNRTIDAAVKGFFSNCQDVAEYRWECIDDIKVIWLSKKKDLLALQSAHFDYDGGAHGDGAWFYKFLRITGDSVEYMGLGDFIDTSAPCLDKISKTIVAEIKKQYPDGGEVGDDRLEKARVERAVFSPTPLGIDFAFGLYQLGPYQMGTPRSFLTRKQLGRCLKVLHH